jgi:hypothetical protein
MLSVNKVPHDRMHESAVDMMVALIAPNPKKDTHYAMKGNHSSKINNNFHQNLPKESNIAGRGGEFVLIDRWS